MSALRLEQVANRKAAKSLMGRHGGDDVPAENESKDDSDNLMGLFIQGLDPGAMLTKYVVVAEGIDEDGDRAVYTSTHEGATAWDVLGLLSYAKGREEAALTKAALEEE